MRKIGLLYARPMTRTILTAIILVLSIWALNKPWGVQIPALGPLLSPYTGWVQNEDQGLPAPYTLEPLFLAHGETELLIDTRGVPHIFAQNNNQAYAILGYLHAHNRLWQMDVSSRLFAGELSALFGARANEIDHKQIARGFRRTIKDVHQAWKKHPETYTQLEAYTRGVNTYINSLNDRNKPIEYKLIHASPRKWSIDQTIAVFKNLSFTLAFRSSDAGLTSSLQKLGPTAFNLLFPLRASNESPVIPSGTKWDFKAAKPTMESDSTSKIELGQNSMPFMPNTSYGSNNWVVNKNKTKDQVHYLCNDPHLGLSLPSIWYEAQIHTPEYNTHGVSVPGVPGIIIGFNEDVAWGVTNVSHDVLDWYQIKWIDKTKRIYSLDGQPTACTFEVETIEHKNGKLESDTCWFTVFGPLPFYKDSTHTLHDCAMRWLGNQAQEKDEASTFIRINKARNIADVMREGQTLCVPAQNLIMTDKTGSIALRISGQLPVRSDYDGRFVLDGSQLRTSWYSFIPDNENPMSINPQQAYLSSANQISTDSTYPYIYLGIFDQYRGKYLNRYLDSMEQVDLEDMKKLQAASGSVFAETGKKLFLKLLNGVEMEACESAIRDSIAQWNTQFDHQLSTPSYFINWWTCFDSLCWDELNTEQGDETPAYWRAMQLAMEQPDLSFFDLLETPNKENAQDLALMAVQKVCKDIGNNIRGDFSWQAYNDVSLTHFMQLDPFSILKLPVNGSRYSLNAARDNFGPSWRMIVALDDKISAHAVYPGGPSGNPGSRFYDYNVDKWVKNDYFDIELYESSEAIKQAGGVLIPQK